MKRLIFAGIFLLVFAFGFFAFGEFRNLFFLTDSVVNETINYAVRLLESEESLTESSFLERVMSKARYQVFEEKFGKDWHTIMYGSLALAAGDPTRYWGKEGYTLDAAAFRALVMSVAREALKTPTGIKGVYSLYKGRMLWEVKQGGASVRAKSVLESTLPFFDGTLPEVKKELLNIRLSLSREGVLGGYDAYLRDNFNISETDIYYFEFVERRRAEGGNALVKAYSEIIKDFLASL
jgi:hypothetical protein